MITFEELKRELQNKFPSALISEARIHYDYESVIYITLDGKRFCFFGKGEEYDYIPLGWDESVKRYVGFMDGYPITTIQRISEALESNPEGDRFSIGMPIE